jgi:hypothetical protein
VHYPEADAASDILCFHRKTPDKDEVIDAFTGALHAECNEDADVLSKLDAAIEAVCAKGYEARIISVDFEADII